MPEVGTEPLLPALFPAKYIVQALALGGACWLYYGPQGMRVIELPKAEHPKNVCPFADIQLVCQQHMHLSTQQGALRTVWTGQ